MKISRKVDNFDIKSTKGKLIKADFNIFNVQPLFQTGKKTHKTRITLKKIEKGIQIQAAFSDFISKSL